MITSRQSEAMMHFDELISKARETPSLQVMASKVAGSVSPIQYQRTRSHKFAAAVTADYTGRSPFPRSSNCGVDFRYSRRGSNPPCWLFRRQIPCHWQQLFSFHHLQFLQILHEGEFQSPRSRRFFLYRLGIGMKSALLEIAQQGPILAHHKFYYVLSPIVYWVTAQTTLLKDGLNWMSVSFVKRRY